MPNKRTHHCKQCGGANKQRCIELGHLMRCIIHDRYFTTRYGCKRCDDAAERDAHKVAKRARAEREMSNEASGAEAPSKKRARARWSRERHEEAVRAREEEHRMFQGDSQVDDGEETDSEEESDSNDEANSEQQPETNQEEETELGKESNEEHNLPEQHADGANGPRDAPQDEARLRPTS